MDDLIDTRKIKRRSDIQAYRGVAVISVLLYHLNSDFFQYGYLGVDIFFVISGFVISNLIYSQITEGKFTIKNFYFQRFRRIVPSLVSFIIFAQILSYFFLDHQFVYQTSLGNLASIFFVSNVYFANISNYFEPDTSLNLIINLWSLSVEEQFYLIFPFFALLTSKLSNKKKIYVSLLVIVISILFFSNQLFNQIGIFERLFANYENFIFYSPFTRAWQFFLGIIAMFINQKIKNKELLKSNSTLFVFSQLFLIYFISFNPVFINKDLKLWILMGFVFLLLVFEITFTTDRNLLLKLLLFTGNISYSLYLFHQPILASIRNHNYYGSYDEEKFYHLDNLLFLFLMILLIYLISYLNFKYIENTYRYITNFSFRGFKLFFSIFFLAIILITSSLTTQGYSFRDSEYKTFSSEHDYEYIVGTNYLKQNGKRCFDRSRILDSCVFNPKGTNREIYILGDSLMSSIVSGFLAQPSLKDYKIIEFTKGSCPVLINKCDFNNSTERYEDIVGIKDSILLLGGKYQEIDMGQYEDELLETITTLTRNNNTVYLFTPFPNPGANIRMYKLINKSFPENNYAIWSKQISQSKALFQNLSLDNLYVIDSEKIFCKGTICDYKSKNTYYFIDHVHFSFYGAEMVADYFVNNWLEE